MSTPAQEMAERHGRMLAELSELTLTAARNLQARLVAAEAPGEAQALGLAFQRLARSLRQTLLLETKLARDHAVLTREAAREAQAAREAALRVRKGQLRRAVTQEIAESCEAPEEAEELLDAVEAMLEAYLRDPELEAAPIAQVCEALCGDLGLAARDEAGEDEAEGAADAAAEAESEPEPEPEPDPTPAEQSDPPPSTPGPSYMFVNGQRLVHDPEHFGWRVVDDSG